MVFLGPSHGKYPLRKPRDPPKLTADTIRIALAEHVMRMEGRNETINFQSNCVVLGESWDPRSQRWTTCSVALGVAPKAVNTLLGMMLTPSPVSTKLANDILRHVILGNLTGPPERLYEILKKIPDVPRDLTKYTVTAPMPIYYDSGNYKDVLLVLVLLVDELRNRVFEVKLALKISRAEQAILEKELEYHRSINTAEQDFLHRSTSRLLGDFNLGDYPQLKRKGLVTIELFEPGITSGKGMDRPGHFGIAREVARCVFRLADTAIPALNGWNRLGSEEPCGSLYVARIPSDLNIKNCIHDHSGTAVLIDPGLWHYDHTFSEILLRIIYVYLCNDAARNKSSKILPLAPLFDAVIAHFGRDDGFKLLQEFWCTLGVYIGTPFNKLQKKFPKTDVTSSATSLMERYGHNDCGSVRISRRLGAMRRGVEASYTYGTPDLDKDRDSTQDSIATRLYDPYYLPSLLPRRQLRNILREVDRFLQNPTGAIGRSRTHRWAGDLVVPPNYLTKKMIDVVLLIPDQKDPSATSIGILTFRLCHGAKNQRVHRYEERSYLKAGRMANLFSEHFQDPEVTKSVALIAQIVYGRFYEECDKFYKNRDKLRPILEKWLQFLSATYVICSSEPERANLFERDKLTRTKKANVWKDVLLWAFTGTHTTDSEIATFIPQIRGSPVFKNLSLIANHLVEIANGDGPV